MKMYAHPLSAEAKQYANSYNEKHNPRLVGFREMTPTQAAWMLEAENLPAFIQQSRLNNLDGDGKASLYYHDAERLLTFYWDGDFNHPVEVSHGGDHEPVSWIFEYATHRPDLVVAGSRSLVLTYQMTCARWIEAREDAR